MKLYTNSRARTFRECAKKHEIEYVRGIRPRELALTNEYRRVLAGFTHDVVVRAFNRVMAECQYRPRPAKLLAFAKEEQAQIKREKMSNEGPPSHEVMRECYACSKWFGDVVAFHIHWPSLLYALRTTRSASMEIRRPVARSGAAYVTPRPHPASSHRFRNIPSTVL